MKFFHISDLHIGLKLFNYDLSEDQKHVFAQIVEAAREEKPDAVVIAGDIYDKAVPSAEAVSLFDDFITSLAAAVPEAEIMMISGNHDSAPRVNVFRRILQDRKIHMVGLPPSSEGERIEKVTLRDRYGEIRFFLLPFVRPSMVRRVVAQENEPSLSYDETVRRLLERESVDTEERNVLVSHQFYVPSGKDAGQIERMDSEICTVGNIDAVGADVLTPFDYAALGHIHKAMKVGNDCFRYCGTPLACSVSEAGQQKAVLIVEMGGKGETTVRTRALHPLRQVRILKGSLSELLTQACDDYVTVCLTDRIDLDVLDMQDRLRAAFPHLLEIRRETVRRPDYAGRSVRTAQTDPFTLCCDFLGNDLTDSEKQLLQDVINSVQA